LGQAAAGSRPKNGLIFSGVVSESPFTEEVTSTVWAVVTELVEAVNVAVVEPDATATEAGTDNMKLLLAKETVNALGATLDNVTVPVVEVPPNVGLGAKARDTIDGGKTFKVAV